MMGLMSHWAREIPDFDTYLKHQFSIAKQRNMAESNSWAVPLKEMRKELFHPVDQANKDITGILEQMSTIACQAWIDKLVDEKKATFQLF